MRRTVSAIMRWSLSAPLSTTFPAATSASIPRADDELPNRWSSAECTFDRMSWSSSAMRELGRFLECRRLGHRRYVLDAVGHPNAGRVEDQGVERRIGPIDTEQTLHGAVVNCIISFNLATSNGGVVNTQTLHEHVLTVNHRRADANTDDVGNVTKKIRRAPTPDEHVAFGGKVENLLRRVPGDALRIDPPAFKQARSPFQKALHFALALARAAGDVLRNEFMVHNIEAQSLGEARRDIPAKGRHLIPPLLRSDLWNPGIGA